MSEYSFKMRQKDEQADRVAAELRRFLPLLLTQTLGAFNDNLFKSAFVMLITYGAATALNPARSRHSRRRPDRAVFSVFGNRGRAADRFERRGCC